MRIERNEQNHVVRVAITFEEIRQRIAALLERSGEVVAAELKLDVEGSGGMVFEVKKTRTDLRL